MTRRILIAVLAAALAGVGLAGCRTNVGAAARVDGHRISESDVNAYLSPGGVDKSVAAQAKTQGQTVSPRSVVLGVLIQEQIYERTLRHLKLSAGAGELAAAHDEAAAVLLQTQLTGSALDRTLDQQLPKSGIKRSFRARLLRSQELEYLIIKKKRLTKFAELRTLVQQAGISVSVSPRYGTWNKANLELTSGAVRPSFLTVQPADGSGS